MKHALGDLSTGCAGAKGWPPVCGLHQVPRHCADQRAASVRCALHECYIRFPAALNFICAIVACTWMFHPPRAQCKIRWKEGRKEDRHRLRITPAAQRVIIPCTCAQNLCLVCCSGCWWQQPRAEGPLQHAAGAQQGAACRHLGGVGGHGARAGRCHAAAARARCRVSNGD